MFYAGKRHEPVHAAAGSLARLLLGLGWPTVSILVWLTSGQRVLRLNRDAGLPLLFLGEAGGLFGALLSGRASRLPTWCWAGLATWIPLSAVLSTRVW